MLLRQQYIRQWYLPSTGEMLQYSIIQVRSSQTYVYAIQQLVTFYEMPGTMPNDLFFPLKTNKRKILEMYYYYLGIILKKYLRL